MVEKLPVTISRSEDKSDIVNPCQPGQGWTGTALARQKCKLWILPTIFTVSFSWRNVYKTLFSTILINSSGNIVPSLSTPSVLFLTQVKPKTFVQRLALGFQILPAWKAGRWVITDTTLSMVRSVSVCVPVDSSQLPTGSARKLQFPNLKHIYA